MKYLKMLGLVACAAAALMAFAGPASATQLTSPTGTALGAGTVIHAELKEGGTKPAELVATFGTIKCTSSTIEGKTSNAGGAAETVRGTVEAKNLTWGGCTLAGSACTSVVTQTGGELEIHALAGTENGTLTAKGFSVKTVCPVFGSPVECVWAVGSSYIHMGTLTASPTPTSHATLTAENVAVSRTSGSAACGSSGKWSGTYTITKPKPLYIS